MNGFFHHLSKKALYKSIVLDDNINYFEDDDDIKDREYVIENKFPNMFNNFDKIVVKGK